MADKKYRLDFALSNGTTESVEFTVQQGERGADGVVDVTGAKVGQTIVVKAVDGNGKPTAWEAVDHQPRTHWAEEGAVIFAEDTVAWDESTEFAGMMTLTAPLVIGNTYKVKFNGTEYVCEAFDYEGVAPAIGNLAYLITEGEDTGEPFAIMYMNGIGMLIGYDMAHTEEFMDGSAVVSIIAGAETVHKIDPKYLPDGVGYTMSNEVEIFHEDTVVWDESTEFMGMMTLTAPLVVGNTYKVKFNGTEYDCKAFDYSGTMLAIGNEAYLMTDGLDTGEPFVIMATDTVGILLGWNTTAEEPTDGSAVVSIIDFSETVHKIDPKYLPDSVGYTEPNDIEIFPEDTVTWDESTDFVGIMNVSEPMVIGNTYKVKFDGIPFVCTAFYYNGMPTLGNAVILDSDAENTGESFAMVYKDGMWLLIYWTDSDDSPEAGSATVSITDCTGIVHKIPTKYLPYNYGGGGGNSSVFTIPITLVGANELETVITPEDVTAHIENGGSVVATVDDETLTCFQMTRSAVGYSFTFMRFDGGFILFYSVYPSGASTSKYNVRAGMYQLTPFTP